ncbi:uncharacterized protein BP01DRAFT_413650 [Aspergillus saccharolyticus JOP 1030-1]|uniref:Uncharacterized protein n=1 Tax=Aspergillus saccharolyticus JOP 1030-1 TaxID=1450539 RepID=A0A319AQ48_9EURO|nr:hypothetical protein BP01DRAFT_413650 [Aspergillus saccharolyticus JOP 1030-1]PYH48532.1 hypothetical protein BP01DRAFT_413650 [Aspergillus saccharolyticus JOP 1030-1]
MMAGKEIIRFKDKTRPISPDSTSCEKNVAVRKLHEEILRSLPLNTLYVGLHLRDDPPNFNDFQWGLYFHDNSNAIARHGHRILSGTGGVFRSNFLCVIPGITCRVWVLAILRKLIERGTVQCPSVGNQYVANASGNHQPRPHVQL